MGHCIRGPECFSAVLEHETKAAAPGSCSSNLAPDHWWLVKQWEAEGGGKAPGEAASDSVCFLALPALRERRETAQVSTDTSPFVPPTLADLGLSGSRPLLPPHSDGYSFI